MRRRCLQLFAACLLGQLAPLGDAVPPVVDAAVSPSGIMQWIGEVRVWKSAAGELEALAAIHRVVVFLTTLPDRIDHIEPVLDSLLRQTWRPDALHLSVPRVHRRSGRRYALPGWLLRKEGVRVSRCDDDGPVTPLLNALHLVRDPWTFVTIVHDDHVYAPRFLETMMRVVVAHPGCAIAVQGFLGVRGRDVEGALPRFVHDLGFEAGPVLANHLGAVYQRAFFDERVYDIPRECMYQPDAWISAHLAAKGIKRGILDGALGVYKIAEMAAEGEESEWAGGITRHCNEALVRGQPGLWNWRRRLVLTLGGLRETRAEQLVRGGPTSQEMSLLVIALRELPQRPDLTYLCLATALAHVFRDTYLFAGFPVVLSDDCVGEEDPGVRLLIAAPSSQEGDAETVVIVATLEMLLGHGAGPLMMAADAATWPEAKPFSRAGPFVGAMIGRLAADDSW
eukprot:NODE_361_length_1635_cov_235.081013.p1 GENE.NODE_361_length_1635_cov_235.081013~~NODE_361_length_1635_cov_235.081013.p1  ORF type:complete len:452 (+),score=106.34 NODE_361_length_1635_cov_235.081013:92-1447(+)